MSDQNGVQSMQTPAGQSSPLLNPPAELRNTIYSMVLTGLYATEVNICDPALPTKTSLLKSCATIRDEATSIFLGENDFRMRLGRQTEDLERAAAWLQALGEDAAWVRKLTVVAEVEDSGWRRFRDKGWKRASQGRYVKKALACAKSDASIATMVLSRTGDHGLAPRALAFRIRPVRDPVAVIYEETFGEEMREWFWRKTGGRATWSRSF